MAQNDGKHIPEEDRTLTTERTSLEAAFKSFLDSGQPHIPQVVMVNPPEAKSDRRSELATAGYAVGLAALLAGTIFAAITFGAYYADGLAEGKIENAVSDAILPLIQENEALRARVERLEGIIAQHP